MPEEDFVRFLEEHPSYYPILKSGLFMEFLFVLEKSSKSLDELHSRFPKIEIKDLELMLNSLKGIGLIKETKAGHKVVFYATKEGKTFLERYRKTKRSFFGSLE